MSKRIRKLTHSVLFVCHTVSQLFQNYVKYSAAAQGPLHNSKFNTCFRTFTANVRNLQYISDDLFPKLFRTFSFCVCLFQLGIKSTIKHAKLVWKVGMFFPFLQSVGCFLSNQPCRQEDPLQTERFWLDPVRLKETHLEDLGNLASVVTVCAESLQGIYPLSLM